MKELKRNGLKIQTLNVLFKKKVSAWKFTAHLAIIVGEFILDSTANDTKGEQ